MAIKRFVTEDEPSIVRRSLGRLELGIDDLSALRKIVSEMPESGTPIFEFDGGEFTEPEDIRKLSDAELKTVRLTAGSVQVILTDREATAIGGDSEVKTVSRLWADTRQVQSLTLPRRVGRVLAIPPGVLSAIFTALAIQRSAEPEYSATSFTVTLLGAGLAFVLGLAVTILTDRSGHSYTKLLALSRDEIRKSRLAEKYPRRAVYITLGSAIIAAGSLTVALISLITR